jgi:hypothetical protein
MDVSPEYLSMWGRQSCLQPPFQAARRLKAGGSQDWLPHKAA